MTELRPCVECRRHVASEAPACPFCGAARATSGSSRPRLGRVSRAAVFAGAALATAACGGKKAKSDTLDNTQTDQATADAGVVEEASPPDPDRSNIPMPYGAPPARRRIV